MASRTRARATLIGAAVMLLLGSTVFVAPAAYAMDEGSASGATAGEASAEAPEAVEPEANSPASPATPPEESPATPESGGEPAVPAEPAEDPGAAPDEAPASASGDTPAPAADATGETPAGDGAEDAPQQELGYTMTWGVSSAWRHAVTDTGGTITADSPAVDGDDSITWPAGEESADDASMTYRGTLVARSAPAAPEADTRALTNPRIVFVSESEAILSAEVTLGSAGAPTEYQGERIDLATVSLEPGDADDGSVVDSPAALLDAGAAALGLAPGAPLDPVSFSLPEAAVEQDDAPIATTLTLKASASTLTETDKVTLTARVEPVAAEGSVQLLSDGKNLGKAVNVTKGSAKFAVQGLSLGSHAMTAAFTPDDTGVYRTSASNTVKITVEREPEPGLKWGVKEKFRNYIYNFSAFKGRSSMLGSAVDSDPKNTNTKTRFYSWSGGGSDKTPVNPTGTKGGYSFGKGNGVRFQSHPMDVDGKTVYALDLQFTNPHIVITSSTAGELRMDVVGRDFISTSQVGKTYRMTDALIADLTLGEKEARGNTLTWTDAVATLTKDGAKAFGNDQFYKAGEALDPVTFTLPTNGKAEAGKATATNLTASSAKIAHGDALTVTASVSPKIAGSVAFTYGNASLGRAVPVKGGKAVLTTSKLPVGIQTITAVFTPKDQEYGSSLGSARVTVTDPRYDPKPGNTGTAAQAAGALQWGISPQFVAYTTCQGKESFGMSHCATNGSISTSGVGGGWLWPQSEGSNWDRNSQTGTVQYSGSVVFNGYGQKMFQVVNPSITVTSATSATLNVNNDTQYGPASFPLDLSSASKSVGATGEVTWTGVPVGGSLVSGGSSNAITLAPLSFTVGAASHVSFGATSEGKKKNDYQAAATAPATTGVTVLTDPDKIRAGGRIEIEARGFDPEDEGVLVVLYDDRGASPFELDDAAKADKTGLVNWSGTLPKDAKGVHTITLQGSTNAGAVIKILDQTKKSAQQAKDAAESEALSSVADGPAAAAGFLGSGGVALWEWWASAGGLAAIAACTTMLAIRQRRRS